jgi:hypothetical protein
MLTTMIHETQAQLYSNPRLANAIKDEVSKEVFENIDQSVIRPVIKTENSLQVLKALVVTSLQQIGNRFQHEAGRADALQVKVTNMERNHTGSYGALQVNRGSEEAKAYADSQFNIVRDIMGDLSRKIDKIIEDTHQDAIKFNGFGFKRFDEAAAWLEIHSPDHKFGLIVDAHIGF